MYSYIRSKTNYKEQISVLRDDKNELVSDRHEIAEILNGHFESIFEGEDLTEMPYFEIRTKERIRKEDILKEINPIEFEKRLNHLNREKSLSCDEVHPLVPKSCAKKFSIPLDKIFTKSISESKIPNFWRLANVSPIFKKGERVNRTNYRKISFTSEVCKVLECFVRCVMINHLT